MTTDRSDARGTAGRVLGLRDADFRWPRVGARWVTAVSGAMTTVTLLLAALQWNLRQMGDLDPLVPPQTSPLAEQLHAAARRAIDTGQTTLLLTSTPVAILTVVMTLRGTRWGAAWVIACGLAGYGLAWLLTLDDVRFVHSHMG